MSEKLKCVNGGMIGGYSICGNQKNILLNDEIGATCPDCLKAIANYYVKRNIPTTLTPEQLEIIKT